MLETPRKVASIAAPTCVATGQLDTTQPRQRPTDTSSREGSIVRSAAATKAKGVSRFPRTRPRPSPQAQNSENSSSRNWAAAAHGPHVDEMGEDSDEDFRAFRRDAREAPQKPSHRGIKVSAGAAVRGPFPSADAITGVHPAYFSCEAGEKVRRAAQEAARESAIGTANSDAELVRFFEVHGLSGPLHAYATSFVLQGVTGVVDLVNATDARLARLLERAELTCADELMLRDALVGLR